MVDYSTELPLLDVFKPSRAWIPFCTPGEQPDCDFFWDTGEQDLIDLDEHGWVRTLPAPQDDPIFWSVGTLMLREIGDRYPAGQYIVLYDGEGTLEYDFAARKDEVASRPGRDVINVTHNNEGVLLKIISTDPNGTGNYIRNSRVGMPDFEDTYESQIFNPDFLSKIAPFRVLRFTDWMFINNETNQGEWGARPRMTDAHWSIEGAPPELMLELANRVHADPWFTMPHRATDEYISEFATLTRDTLAGDRRVYVEYSNEVWNTVFQQGDWVEQQTQAAWPRGEDDGYFKRINWYGKRMAEVCETWKSVWGDQSERVVCVMASHAAVPWTLTAALDCPLWVEGAPCVEHGIDALAIAPYFGVITNEESDDVLASWSSDADGGVNRVFDELTIGGLLPDSPPGGILQEVYSFMSDGAPIADSYGLEFITYEGGQHLVKGGFDWEDSDPTTTLFKNVNRDARMGELYSEYLAEGRSRGGQLFVHYKTVGKWNRWGSWGALEYLDQDASPKYAALMEFISTNPCWWPNCTTASN